jgi:hypothetical protein
MRRRLLSYFAVICCCLFLRDLIIQSWGDHPGESDLIVSGIAIVFFCQLVPWQLVGLWFPLACLVLLFLAIGRAGSWWLVSGLLSVFLLVGFLVRIYDRKSAITLQFPLRNGVFYTAHGGAFPFTNYHGIYVREQRYACDFVRLNRWGIRALGILPAKLGRYFIYGVPVYAPITGKVLRAADGFPDLPAGELRNENPPGNHVIIRPDGLELNVLLAHLQNGSVLVKTGDRVTANRSVR